jgi:hypothetical protein
LNRMIFIPVVVWMNASCLSFRIELKKSAHLFSYKNCPDQE